ncbi:cobalt-precorrin 5A hydrolase [Suicoccus acidiformans]|uniref:cobalt-precorrin 5A hydrolase n=1 Tax=Suicoccus acidiformans TaxID=2036206 RepID=UPI0013C369BB|nr:cobalt-precorrin 5A hydrolase [Suicoccus acidiformans]
MARRIQTRHPLADLYVKTRDDADPLEAKYREYGLIDGKMLKTLRENFKKYDSLVCIMASGIVIRGIAPMLESKYEDPAVLLLDEQGRFVVSLLSGHVGGANEYATSLAQELGAQAVITTATDNKGVLGLDMLAKGAGCVYEPRKVLSEQFNMLLAEEQVIALYNEPQLNLVSTSGYQIFKNLPDVNELLDYAGFVMISVRMNALDTYRKKLPEDYALAQLVPKKYVLGVGCRKGVDSEVLSANFRTFCLEHNFLAIGLTKIVSIDLKKEENAIINLAESLNIPFETYSKEDLLEFEDFYPGSNFVKQTVGVSSVAQTSVHKETGEFVLTERYANEGVTFALGKYQ